jgi:hypothetical protein
MSWILYSYDAHQHPIRTYHVSIPLNLHRLKFHFHHGVLRDEMNKTRSHLHMFSKKLNYLIIALNLHHLFITAESIMWVFFIFWPSKIRISPTGIIIPFHRRPTSIIPPHNDIHGDKLADPLSPPEQLFGMWIHVNIRYFKILQHWDYQLV